MSHRHPVADVRRTHALRRAACAGCLVVLVAGCTKGADGPQHRERSVSRDPECREPERPFAFFYPAKDRTEYGPDDPKADGCELLVPDHLFCCPKATRPTDR